MKSNKHNHQMASRPHAIYNLKLKSYGKKQKPTSIEAKVKNNKRMGLGCFLESNALHVLIIHRIKNHNNQIR